jgi:hypothetical protein
MSTYNCIVFKYNTVICWWISMYLIVIILFCCYEREGRWMWRLQAFSWYCTRHSWLLISNKHIHAALGNAVLLCFSQKLYELKLRYAHWSTSLRNSFTLQPVYPPCKSYKQKTWWAPEPVWTLWKTEKCMYRYHESNADYLAVQTVS